MSSKALCLILVVITILATPMIGSEIANENAEEIKKLRERLQAQEIQLTEQRQEIDALKAAVRQLVDNTERNQVARMPCKESAGDRCGVDQSASNTALVQETAQVKAANVSSEELKPQFKFGGDVRVRFENITQDPMPSRYRTRLRVRFGVESTLHEDLTAGFYLATGTLDDPVSTNATLTQFFTRKTIGIDRGWLTYHPGRYEWLEVTAGKFTPNWHRSSLSFDPDLNSEGFQEKLSFEVKNPLLKKVTVSGMQLLLNELPGATLPVSSGADSYAFGGQFGAQLQLGRRVKTTLYASGLSWHNTDTVIQAVTAGSLAGNRNTNATINTSAGVQYASRFLYADFIADTTFEYWA